MNIDTTLLLVNKLKCSANRPNAFNVFRIYQYYTVFILNYYFYLDEFRLNKMHLMVHLIQLLAFQIPMHGWEWKIF